MFSQCDKIFVKYEEIRAWDSELKMEIMSRTEVMCMIFITKTEKVYCSEE